MEIHRIDDALAESYSPLIRSKLSHPIFLVNYFSEAGRGLQGACALEKMQFVKNITNCAQILFLVS